MAPPTVRKFTFDVRFDEPTPSERQPVLSELLISEPPPEPEPELPPEPEEPPPVVFSQEELEFAREEAYVAGHAAALQEAAASVEQFVAEALNRCAESMTALASKTDPLADAATSAAIQVVHTICRKLLPHTADDYAIREITSLVQFLLPDLIGQPRILIHTSPKMVDLLRKRLTETISKTGFEGRMVLLGDSVMLPTDARVEWADGGAERNMAKALDEIDALMQRNIPLFQQGQALEPGHLSHSGEADTITKTIEDIWPDIDPAKWYTPPDKPVTTVSIQQETHPEQENMMSEAPEQATLVEPKPVQSEAIISENTNTGEDAEIMKASEITQQAADADPTEDLKPEA
ncbi:hypothetical protein HEQ72_00620 [Haematospirillum sp. 15-248]|uniref:FliH/SctL family protein n=1 Tax=Haematospirillum sp. 15-248 TaxID=2723107 RepID=UPI001438F56A|nr:FliH/SctL family protein [Haematospirillum sp. 15-248]NKD86823.1 hypothetical protein [Haematospirillum sp. 15-248]